jgi:hypothetical protein
MFWKEIFSLNKLFVGIRNKVHSMSSTIIEKARNKFNLKISDHEFKFKLTNKKLKII